MTMGIGLTWHLDVSQRGVNGYSVEVSTAVAVVADSLEEPSNSQPVSHSQLKTASKPVKQVRAKTMIRRYENVCLTKVVKSYQKGAIATLRS